MHVLSGGCQSHQSRPAMTYHAHWAQSIPPTFHPNICSCPLPWLFTYRLFILAVTNMVILACFTSTSDVMYHLDLVPRLQPWHGVPVGLSGVAADAGGAGGGDGAAAEAAGGRGREARLRGAGHPRGHPRRLRLPGAPQGTERLLAQFPFLLPLLLLLTLTLIYFQTRAAPSLSRSTCCSGASARSMMSTW